MQHVALSKANKAVAWARHLFEFPGKFPLSYSDVIYDDNINRKKNYQAIAWGYKRYKIGSSLVQLNQRSQFLLSSFALHPSDKINTLQNARNYKCFLQIKRLVTCCRSWYSLNWKLAKNHIYILFSKVMEHSRAEIKTRNLSFCSTKSKLK